jgi:hypothetical protein
MTALGKMNAEAVAKQKKAAEVRAKKAEAGRKAAMKKGTRGRKNSK